MGAFEHWLEGVTRFEKIPAFDGEWHGHLAALVDKCHASRSMPVQAADLPDNCLWRDISEICARFQNSNVVAYVDAVAAGGVFGWCKDRHGDGLCPASIMINNQAPDKIRHGIYRKDVHLSGIGTGQYGFQAEFAVSAIVKPYLYCSVWDKEGNLAAYRFFNLHDVMDASGVIQAIAHLAHSGHEKWARMLLEPMRLLPNAAADASLKLAGCAFGLGDKKAAFMHLRQAANAGPAPSLADFLSFVRQKNAWQEGDISLFFELVYTFRLFPQTWDEIYFLNGLFQDYLATRPVQTVRYLYDNFVNNYIIKPGHAKGVNFLRDKMAFVTGNLQILSYWLPLIKLFPFGVADIVCVYESEDHLALLAEYGLEEYRVHIGLERVSEYKLCILDDNLYMHDKSVNEALLHTAKILLTHTAMGRMEGLDTADLGIYPAEKLCLGKKHIMLTGLEKPSRKLLASLSPSQKCELAYTGPYHMGDNLRADFSDKHKYRELLEQEMGWKLPAGKPVILCVEEQHFCLNQIVRALNMLADDCIVIFRPYYRTDWNQINKLREDVFIYTKMHRGGESGFHKSPNTARFAADYILCGMFNGTFYSSLMIGLNVLPYYTRIIKHKNFNQPPFFCAALLERHRSGEIDHPFSKYIYNHWPYFFDMLDVAKIREAILGKEYLGWLHKNMGKIQKHVFGNYYLDKADIKTVEYILKYSGTGTLGDDAASIYLKK